MRDKTFLRLITALFLIAFLVCGTMGYLAYAEQKPNGLPDIVAKSLTIKGEQAAGRREVTARRA